jgi:WD40 repeat protein
MNENEKSSLIQVIDHLLEEKMTTHHFTNLHLTRLIKENHGDGIRQLKFFKSDSFDKPTNLVATCGSTQANVYDNEHLGGHLDLVSQFNLPGQQFTCLCWLELESDVLLVLGSSDCHVHIVSLAYSKEIMLLKGHKGICFL